MKIKVSIFLVFILLISTSLNLIGAISTTEDKIVSLDTEVSIVRPNGYLYIFNVQLVPLPSRMPFRAIIVGMVNVEVDVKNESINKVEFYVDDELKATITQAPYNWTWNERLRPPPIHNLKIIGYNNSTEIGRDEIRLLYVNPFRFGPQT